MFDSIASLIEFKAVTLLIGLISVSFVISLAVARLIKPPFAKLADPRKIQDSHQGSISAYGGAVVFCLVLVLSLVELYTRSDGLLAQKIALIGGLVFAIGFVGDLGYSILPKFRALLILLVAAFSISEFGWLSNIGIGMIDVSVPFAIFITLVAIVGLTNSFNLLDGLHGLSAGTALLIFASLSYIAFSTGFTEFSAQYAIIFCCTLGFFFVNFPCGRLFLGDGGAYFLGFLVAQGCITLHLMQHEVSSWFFFTICIYPICETLFTIIRRLHSRQKWFLPDRRHLHQLVLDFLVSRNPGTRAGSLDALNPLASAVCLALVAVSCLAGIFLFDKTLGLLIFDCAFFGFYVITYRFMHYKLSSAS